MSLSLTEAAYFRLDGYPMLRVRVNGRDAELGPDAKPTVHAAGLVFLGSGFADVCPVVTLHPPDGGPTELVGFSADPRLFRLYDDFLRAAAAGTFQAGPVAIPD